MGPTCRSLGWGAAWAAASRCRRRCARCGLKLGGRLVGFSAAVLQPHVSSSLARVAVADRAPLLPPSSPPPKTQPSLFQGIVLLAPMLSLERVKNAGANKVLV